MTQSPDVWDTKPTPATRTAAGSDRQDFTSISPSLVDLGDDVGAAVGAGALASCAPTFLPIRSAIRTARKNCPQMASSTVTPRAAARAGVTSFAPTEASVTKL